MKKTKSVLAGTVIAELWLTQALSAMHKPDLLTKYLLTQQWQSLGSPLLEAFQIVRVCPLIPKRYHFGCSGVFPRRALCRPTKLGREGVSQIIFYKKHDKGGHFAAWEQPQLLTKIFVRPLFP
jgi:hypothetical protein